MQAFCRDHLAGYKVPRSFELTDEIPRSASGKIQKRQLREPHWAGRTSRRVSRGRASPGPAPGSRGTEFASVGAGGGGGGEAVGLHLDVALGEAAVEEAHEAAERAGLLEGEPHLAGAVARRA